MRLVIKNTKGEFWNGTTFGPLQFAKRYKNRFVLPLALFDVREKTFPPRVLKIMNSYRLSGPLSIRYHLDCAEYYLGYIPAEASVTTIEED
jgi:hypothetical protein